MSLGTESQSPPASLQPIGDRVGSQCLRFQLQLDRETAKCWSAEPLAVGASSQVVELAIEMKTSGTRAGVTELIDIPSDRVVPIPHLPPAVMGVYNWRGEILWIVDLAMLLGSQQQRFALAERRFYPTIAISSEPDRSGTNKTIGLVVDEIADIEWCELQPIAASQPLALNSWIKGYAIALGGEKLPILDELAPIDRAGLDADLRSN